MSDEGGVWPTTIVPGEDLVGREEVIARIVRRIQAGRSVMLPGPRRLGKTSVAEEALRRLADEGAVTASLDFFSLTTKREVADVLLRQLLANSHGLGARLRQLGSAAFRAVKRVEPHVTVALLELGVNLREADEGVVFRTALQAAQKIADREDTRVVVLMDEFQEASRNLGQNVYQIMRAAFQRQPKFQQLFVGSEETLLRELFTKPNAALLRHATEVRLTNASPEAWLSYIERKFQSAEIDVDPSAIREIIQLTGGHPADTIEFCQQLHLLALERGLSSAGLEMVPVALEDTERALKSIFDQTWAALGSVSYTRLVARRIALGEPVFGKKTGGEDAPQSLAKALKELLDRGIVDRLGRGRYRFREPMFERYVRRLIQGGFSAPEALAAPSLA